MLLDRNHVHNRNIKGPEHKNRVETIARVNKISHNNVATKMMKIRLTLQLDMRYYYYVSWLYCVYHFVSCYIVFISIITLKSCQWSLCILPNFVNIPHNIIQIAYETLLLLPSPKRKTSPVITILTGPHRPRCYRIKLLSINSTQNSMSTPHLFEISRICYQLVDYMSPFPHVLGHMSTLQHELEFTIQPICHLDSPHSRKRK